MALTPARVSRPIAAHAIGFQVSAATIGVAVLPTIAGHLSRLLGLEVISPLLLITAATLLVLHEIVNASVGRSIPESAHAGLSSG